MSRAAIARALVIGGGIAGMSAALSMAEAGIHVDLIDRDPNWRVYGAGITITGPTLRVMGRLGILDQVMAEGWTADGILACDPSGAVVAEISTGDGDGALPGAGGILRPALHRMLAARVRAQGIAVRLGLGVSAIAPGLPKAVTFSDGTTGRYDLVVGADGIHSTTRDMIFPESGSPRFVGQICWRLMCARHPEITRRTYFLGGPMKVGLNPVAPDQMYMFLLEPADAPLWVDEATQHSRLFALMEGFGGVLADVRAGLSPDSRIVARPLEAIFCPAPWHRDGVLLIGDAAHATTPQLASGAGMAMEDGVVLGEVLAKARTLEQALDAFMARRFDRCALVVETSLALGRLERATASPGEQIRLVQAALDTLNQPY